MLRKVLLAVFPIFFALASFGQNKVDIIGKVIDDNDSFTLPQVTIQLVVDNDTLLSYTNNEGIFKFSLPPTKNVKIAASHVGYKTYYTTIDADANVDLEIILLTDSEMLGEIVVTGKTRAIVSTSAMGQIHINTEKLTQVPSVLGVPDVIRVLQLTPGVQNSGEANGYLYVRGADPGHNLMMYDDAPVYGMSHLLGIFPFYNTDHINNIHFDKTGTDIKYGNRLGAALQSHSPNLIPERFSVKGNLGLVASQLTLQAPINDKLGFYISGRKTYIDEIITPLINSAAENEENAIDDLSYTFGDINFTFLAKPSVNHQLSTNVFISGDKFGIKERKMMLDGKLKWSNNTASINWLWSIKDDISFKQSVYYSQYNNKLGVRQASIDLDVQSKVIDWGANSTLQFKLFKTAFEAGLQLSAYHVRPQEIVNSQLEIDNIKNTNNKTEAWQTAVYLQAKPKINHSLYLDLGLRMNRYASMGSNKKTFLNVEPRISLQYSPNAIFNGYIAYSRKNQYLNLITTSSVGFPTDFWLISNVDVPSQSADNFSVGSIYKPVLNVEFSLGLFYNKLNKLIEYPFSILQFNEITNFGDDIYVGKGKAYGVELMLRKTGRLSGWISYTLSKSDRQFDDIYPDETFPAKFDRRHNLSVVANYQLSKKWSIGLTQVYASGSRFTVPTSWYFINNNPIKEYDKLNNAKMPDYIRTDLSVDFFLKKTDKQESALNLSIYNMFAVNNPIYVILDITPNNNETEVVVYSRYKSLYSILPSVGWRFKF
ncbi:TonB-dependent receptor [Parabacteroides sp. PF5-9]|uniref:TonB-dependent receptor n=1 Tax=Parabacteroides sp. PF5-9 TaxID=1742404 RepID=UPI0024757DAF|nr:TonB-dependent receptor [Parabacteroides sp. PF5-9]